MEEKEKEKKKSQHMDRHEIFQIPTPTFLDTYYLAESFNWNSFDREIHFFTPLSSQRQAMASTTS
jgi:hypothetical protein